MTHKNILLMHNMHIFLLLYLPILLHCITPVLLVASTISGSGGIFRSYFLYNIFGARRFIGNLAHGHHSTSVEKLVFGKGLNPSPLWLRHPAKLLGALTTTATRFPQKVVDIMRASQLHTRKLSMAHLTLKIVPCMELNGHK